MTQQVLRNLVCNYLTIFPICLSEVGEQRDRECLGPSEGLESIDDHHTNYLTVVNITFRILPMRYKVYTTIDWLVSKSDNEYL